MSSKSLELVPTPEQVAKRDCRASDILVAAGAGTGKTTTTRPRFARLLEEEIDGGAAPEEALGRILVFTFTDKAAGELEEGVRKDTAPLLSPESPEAATMSSAWVGTFHSICARILRSFPLEAGIDPGFEVVDQVDAIALKSRAFSQALSTLLDSPEEEAERTRAAELVSTFGLERLGEEIRDAYDELRARGIADPSLPVEDLPTLYPTALVEEILSRATEIAESDRKNLSPKKNAKRLAESLGRGDRLTIELAEECQSRSKEDGAINHLSDLLAKAVGKLAAIEDEDLTYRTVSQLLELYGTAYTRLKERDSLLDFEDLQLRTRDLLRDDGKQVGAYYRERFREIMVDEFQDTNGLQLDLIDSLRGPGTTLMTVGDELQSIYRFRHANVQIFRDRGRNIPTDGQLEMKGNNRSDRTVLAAVNGLGRALDERTRERRSENDTGRHRFTELEQGEGSSRGEGAAGSVRLLLVERGDWGHFDLGEIAPARSADPPAGAGPGPDPEAQVDGKAVDFVPAEAMAVAQSVRDLVEGGMPQKEIVILLRSMTRSRWYEEALRQVGLTPYTISGRGFWGSDAVQTLVALLRIVANPLDEDSVLTGMLSPACGASADLPPILRRGAEPGKGLWATARAATSGDKGTEGWLGKIDPGDLGYLSDFFEAIEGVRQRALNIPLDQLVEETAVATGYDLAALEREPGAIQEMKRLASIANEYEGNHSRDLRGFLDWIDASEAEDDEAQVATEDERSEVVRIMTVHAAKGAQFEAVFVPDLGRRFRADNHSLLILGPSEDPAEPDRFDVGVKVGDHKAYDWKLIEDKAKAANEDEELRLLHVAMTRACGLLVLSGCPHQSESTSEFTSIADRLCEELGVSGGPADGSWSATILPEGMDGLIEVETIPATSDSAETLARERDPVAGEGEQGFDEFPPLSRPRVRTYPDIPLSFTALAEFGTCPLRFYAKRVLRLDESGHWPFQGPEAEPTGRRADGAAFGTAIHALLETAAGRSWAPPTQEDVAASLRAEGISGEESIVLAERMIAGLLDSDFMTSVRVKGVRAEVPIILGIEDVVIRGFIDLLVPGDETLIVDFKTNRLDGESPEELMEGEYGLQRDLYALAVSKSGNDRDPIGAVRTAFVFLDGASGPVPVFREYGKAELDRAETEVRGLVDRILSPTDSGADGRLGGCGECWACERLAADRLP